MNRKEEAYIYTSIALRLAVTHGYHRPLEGTQIFRSEKAHIGRLWWTIYMQERRLAAATGYPYGIDDAFIVLEYPVDQFGFSSSQPIRTNARIARVTSRILIDLYSPKRQNQDSFVTNVKEIIKCLHDISGEIPENLATVAHGPNANVSVRTTASLQLMVYQATLLTIRPVMLHVAHLILAGERSGLEQLGKSSLTQLCRACTEAARRIVRTILTLRRMNLLGNVPQDVVCTLEATIFGFFDCDAIFSATFVLILTVVFDSACEDKDKINPSPGLGEALENLQYLSDNHNTTAIERLQEVQDIWCHLPEHFRTNENTVVPSRDRSQTMHDNIRQLAGDSSHGPIVHDCTGPLNNHGVTDDTTQLVMDLGQPRPIPGLSGVEQDSIELRLDAEHDVSNFPNEMSPVWIPPSANIGIVPSDNLIPIDMPMDEYFAHFQSLLDNPDWYLTGRDVGDLAEFGRHIANLSRTE
ncbi:unnamed protein product [Clonostachys rosea f. rosea IK726]|uniref:Uncharacterized protein n=1 Tax=Clonostachys rosea f. rosea IK726 TaxID=1349383 RepID=A0ACA9T644_BIOOC|nr:unnamed protein product [Clonostachys rosea f. rosea IK726]